MYSVAKYSIYVYDLKNKLVHVSRNIDDFHEWMLENVKFTRLLDFKNHIENRESMMFVKSNRIELFKWINYLSFYLTLNDYQMSISMQL